MDKIVGDKCEQLRNQNVGSLVFPATSVCIDCF